MGILRGKALQPWVVMPVAALLAFGGWFAVRPGTDGADGAATTATTATTEATATEQVVEATVADLARTVSADGTVAAAQTDDLSFASSGTVTAVDVAAGDAVAKGDVLATIDSAELAAAVTDAEAALAEAEATRSDDTDAGASDAQLTADQAAVTSAQDQLATAREALDGAALVATFDGTVASVDLTVGEELAGDGSGGTDATGSASGSGRSAGTLGSSSTQAAPGGTTSAATGTASTAQVQVVSTGSFTVELSFDDTDIAELAVGQTATVALSTSTSSTSGFPGGMGGFPGMGRTQATDTDGDAVVTTTTTPSGTTPTSTTGGTSVTGLVTEVGKVADASSGVASYPVTVAFTDTAGTFHAGATATVDVAYDSVADAVQVPARAITTGTDGTTTVIVSDDGRQETRTVATGLTAGTMTQITDGLEAGESVVVTVGRPAGFDPSQLPGAGG